MRGRKDDLVGLKYGRLVVTGLADKKAGRRLHWECSCECGGFIVVRGSELKAGNTVSCGCYNRQAASARLLTHGFCRFPEYSIWTGLVLRCTDPKIKQYPDYGGRGITVCEEWLSFENFYRDMGPRPSRQHSLDRKDNNGNYCKDNCRWATMKEQQNNRRSNRILELGGESLTMSQWSDKIGIRPGTILARLSSGWSVERALTQPLRGKKS